MYTPFQLAKRLGVTKETLRTWETEGKISATKTKGGHRRYNMPTFGNEEPSYPHRCIAYARVSSQKQKADLERQIEFLRSRFPTYEIISDIGSGINFKRKGLLSILDLAMQGKLKDVVVAHKDRLCRFGFEILDHIFRYTGATITILEDSKDDPTEDLSKDIMSIITVFSARYHGSRKYNQENGDSEDEDIPKPSTEGSI
jgi:excisionase family DNA binding protein